MREQLIQYVDLLFAGAENCEEIKQEILQNTLDRYDDLIAEGKVPEAAYRLAITGIGDINEILGTPRTAPTGDAGHREPAPKQDADTPAKKTLRAVAVALYILCPIPLFVLSELGMDVIGLCGTLVFVAAATAMMVLGAKKGRPEPEPAQTEVRSPRSELSKGVSGLVWAIGLALYFVLSFATMAWHVTWVIFLIIPAVQGLIRLLVGDDSKKQRSKTLGGIIWTLGTALYFIVSFATNAWYVTWVIFLITGAVQGLVNAIFDLMEANTYEN